MRITSLFRRVPACCAAGTDHCHGTLVLHADGTVECEHEATCDADETRHELWVTCDELRCGCLGDDAPLEGEGPLADLLLAA